GPADPRPGGGSQEVAEPGRTTRRRCSCLTQAGRINGAGGRNRTGMGLSALGILSPVRLPIPPLRPRFDRLRKAGGERRRRERPAPSLAYLLPPFRSLRLEATGGFEPPNKGFADLSLNHLGTSP